MVEVTGRILVVGEQEHFLAFEFSCQQFFEAGELGVPVGCDGADVVPDCAQGFGVAAQVVMKTLEIVERGVEGRQCLDELARLSTLIELIGERRGQGRQGWGGIVLFVLAGEVARRFLEAGAVEDPALQDVAFKGFEKLQGAAHADTEGLDAALEALEVATLEDTGQRLFASLLELVAPDTLFLVGLQAIGREPQGLDAVDDLVVDTAVGSLQIVANGLQPAFGPVDRLTFDGGVGIGLFNKGAGAADDQLFQQVEEGNAGLLLVVGAAGGLEVLEQVPDPPRGEVAAIPAGDEVDLVVEVKNSIIDRGGREQYKFLALTAHLAPAVIGGQDALQG